MFLGRKFFIATVVAASVFSTSALTASAASIDVPSGTYQSDPHHTNLLWNVKHFGLSNYYGRFDSIKATLDLDAQDVAKSTLNVTIDPNSVDTNYAGTPNEFNIEIAGTKFFDAAKYNTITFKSTSIDVTSDNTGKVTGDLTFHGVTKPVTLDVKFNGSFKSHPMTKLPTIGFSATGVIKRSDFGVDTLVGPVSDDVQLTIETELSTKQ